MIKTVSISIAALMLFFCSCSQSEQSAFTKRKYFDFKNGSDKMVRFPVVKSKTGNISQLSTIPKFNSEQIKSTEGKSGTENIIAAQNTWVENQKIINRSQPKPTLAEEIRTVIENKSTQNNILPVPKKKGGHGKKIVGGIIMLAFGLPLLILGLTMIKNAGSIGRVEATTTVNGQTTSRSGSNQPYTDDELEGGVGFLFSIIGGLLTLGGALLLFLGIRSRRK